MNLYSLGVQWLWEALNYLWLVICKGIYGFINWLYEVFEKVASVNLFSTEVFEKITGRIYVIIGIAMLFVFAYNMILLIVNPDDKKKIGATSSLVKEIIISLVAIVLLPTIFNWLYIFQTHVLESNIIGQVIMGGIGNTSGDQNNCASDDYECLCDFSKFEKLKSYKTVDHGWFWSWSIQDNNVQETLAANCRYYRSDAITDSQRGARIIGPTIFSAFYRPTKFTYEQCYDYLAKGDTSVISDSDTESQEICTNYYFDVSMAKYTGNLQPFLNDEFLNDKISFENDFSMDFQWLFAIGAGAYAVWMFLCYCLEIGVRVSKLGFLQLISPITVMMRVVPGQKQIYEKWFGNLVTTYVDIFIRLFIIFFVLFAIGLVPDVLSTFWESNWSGDGDWFIKTLSMVIVILGMMKFAQEAPNLLKEIIPKFGSGNFSFKSPAKQIRENKGAMGTLGMLGGGASAMAGNLYHGVKKVKNTKGAMGKIGAGIGALASGAGGLIGGARRGVQQGVKSKNFEELKFGVQRAKTDSDAARSRHIATRKKGAIDGVEVPVISAIVGKSKETWGDVKKGAKNLGSFIAGNESNERLSAAREVASKFEATEAVFKKATIVNIENAQQKAMEPYYSGNPIEFNGEIYKKNSAGNWEATNGVHKDEHGNAMVMSHEAMGKYINDHFDKEKKNAYVAQYEKNLQALSTNMTASMEALSKNISKMGEDFSRTLFDKLKDPNGLNLNVNNVEELTGEIDRMLKNSATLSTSTSADDKAALKKQLSQLYEINDTLKKQSKASVERNAPLERKQTGDKK